MTRRKVVRTVSAWLAVVVVFEGSRIVLALSGPPSPDLYANELGFQLATSALFLFIGWLPLLAAALLFSTTFADLRARSLESKGDRPRGPEEGFEYVYVNQDGSARELSPAERDYLSMDFEGGDGGRPYVKAGYRSRDGWGSLSGFIKRRDVPARIAIEPVHPDYDALEKQLRDDILGLLSVAGTVATTDADGAFTAGAADDVSAHERFERARQHYLAGQRRREQLAKVT